MNLRLKRWITAGAALAMISTMGLSACSSNRALTSETGKNEVTMASRIPNWIFPVSAKGYTQGENGQLIQAMYRPLFAYKSTSETPYKINLPKSLGTVPEVSEDGKTYTIKLRDDATWSDGTAVSTRDVEFWWNLVTNNKDQWASYKEGFFPDGASLDIKDEHTFSITTTDTFNPSWFIDNQINKVALLPQHAWDKTSADEAVSDLDRTPEGAQKVFAYLQGEAKNLSSYATNPLWQTVNGPWKLKEFTPDQGLTLVPNENYWGEDKPKIDKLIYKSFTGDDAEFNSVRSGSIDFGYIPAAQYNQRKAVENKGYNVFLWPGNSITYLALNFAPQAPSSKYINQKYNPPGRCSSSSTSRRCRTRSGPTPPPRRVALSPWQLTRSVPPKAASTSSIRTPQRSSWKTTAGRSCPTVPPSARTPAPARVSAARASRPATR